MTKVRFFYDYECPFCKKGFEDLMDDLPSFPDIEIEWRPIESHPRPENQRPHTDLCIQAFYIAEGLGADMTAFHKAMFQAVLVDGLNVEKDRIIAEALKGVVDGTKFETTFLEVLKSGKYASRVNENNDLAYEKSGVWFVPAFRIPGSDLKSAPRLDAKGGIGVSWEEIKRFLEKAGTA
jgi:predicted DsbA family dithiol-disulfide isomerase